MKSHFVAILAATLASLPLTAYAGGGTSVGGGGDASEARVNEIRADILKWIVNGGAKELKLPSGVAYDVYESGMERVLAPHAVVVGFVTADQENSAWDPELRVSVDGQPKTCRSFISNKDSMPHILCNTERFASASEGEQYRLVHHEYAGLAGVERNVGASSDYEISNQLTDYLVPETVLRLSVKKNPVTSSAQFEHEFELTCKVTGQRFDSSTGRSVLPGALVFSSHLGTETNSPYYPDPYVTRTTLKPASGQGKEISVGTAYGTYDRVLRTRYGGLFARFCPQRGCVGNVAHYEDNSERGRLLGAGFPDNQETPTEFVKEAYRVHMHNVSLSSLQQILKSLGETQIPNLKKWFGVKYEEGFLGSRKNLHADLGAVVMSEKVFDNGEREEVLDRKTVELGGFEDKRPSLTYYLNFDCRVQNVSNR
jgi:hypothetical protein